MSVHDVDVKHPVGGSLDHLRHPGQQMPMSAARVEEASLIPSAKILMRLEAPLITGDAS